MYHPENISSGFSRTPESLVSLKGYYIETMRLNTWSCEIKERLDILLIIVVNKYVNLVDIFVIL